MPVFVDPELAETRRRKLLRFCNERYNGNRAELARESLVHPNHVNLMLSDNEAIRRPMTDMIAARMCENLGLEPGYFDAAARGGRLIEAGPVDAALKEVFTQSKLVTQLGVSGEWLERHRCAGIADQLTLVEVACEDMRPELPVGQIVVYAAGVADIDRDGVYVFKGKAGTMLRRVRRSLQGVEVLSPGDQSPQILSTMRGVKVLGRIVAELIFR
jgi:hypothetical protein